MTTQRLLGGALVLGAVAVHGCAADTGRPKTFSTDWVDDQGKSISEVQARLRHREHGTALFCHLYSSMPAHRRASIAQATHYTRF